MAVLKMSNKANNTSLPEMLVGCNVKRHVQGLAQHVVHCKPPFMGAAVVVMVAVVFGGGTTWFHYKSQVGNICSPRTRSFVWDKGGNRVG